MSTITWHENVQPHLAHDNGRLSGLSAAKPLAALCRVGPIEAYPDGAGDVVASDAPVGGESTDDV
jgi:hypothetical protein